MKPKYNQPVKTHITEKQKEEILKYCKDNETNISDFLRSAIELKLEIREEEE